MLKVKKIYCTNCGKELINLTLPNEKENRFWCDDCNLEYMVRKFFDGSREVTIV